ncbi:MAG: HAMP domain-containing histidine kinase [Kiritimatiellae bacterium]|nr:HAMP domain-containing histidine kinase [Kiritimatiellia bacterium]
MRLWPRSLRWRLQLWYGTLLAAVLAGFAATAFALARESRMRRVDEDLERRTAALMPALRPPLRDRLGGLRAVPPAPLRPDAGDPGGRRPATPDERPPGVERASPPRFRPEPHGPPPGPPLDTIEAAVFPETGRDAAYFFIVGTDGTVQRASVSAPPPPADFELPAADRAVRQRGELREHVRRLRPGLALIVGRPIGAELAELRRFGAGLVTAAALVWVAALAVGARLVRRAIRPLETISATAARIAAGDLGSRIALADTDSELGALARVLNDTFDRLCEALARQTRFTADASHELRTPLAVILSQTESALARERPPAEYREALEACRRAARRLQHLVESLLMLARFDAGGGGTPPESVPLERVAADALDLLRPLAAERRLEIVADLRPAVCEGRAEELAQVALNLIANAIHYNRDGGRVEIVTWTDEKGAHLTVRDTGIGIAPEHLPRIFERFYRADPARSRSSGRAGLGLAIAQEAVRRQGGRIEVSSQPGRGSEFVVTLPTAAR